MDISHAKKSGKLSDTGDSFYAFAVFDRAEVERAFRVDVSTLPKWSEEEMSLEDVGGLITGWYVTVGGGAGRWFTQPLVVKVFGRKILVRQFRAIDC